MNAANLIEDLQELGVRLEAVDGQLAIDAPVGTLTPEIIGQLRAAKSKIIRALGWDAGDWQAFFGERAAIAEFDAGLSRPEAEAQARVCAVSHLLNRTAPDASPNKECDIQVKYNIITVNEAREVERWNPMEDADGQAS